MSNLRQSGILMHPTSLAGPEGIGTLGREAHGFADFLAAGGQKLWQMLPLGPAGYGDSPYACFSAFAGNPLLISLETLVRDRLLTRAEVGAPAAPAALVDFRGVEARKPDLLDVAFTRFLIRGVSAAFTRFCAMEAGWLDDYALFMAIKESRNGQPWWQWPETLRLRQPEALEAARRRLEPRVAAHQFRQFLFFEQWRALRAHANAAGVRLVGDVPIYVAHDSADVWAYPEWFMLDARRRPVRVSGVPPDFFSRDGQLWGNPVYDWGRMKRDGFTWWRRRWRASLELFDVARFDHFRALAGYWGVPYGKRTARDGAWYRAPGGELLASLKRDVGDLRMIVEDLGMITPDVLALRDRYGLPGMKILHYAFGENGDSGYIPHNFPENCVVYTGTHDNETTTGWWRQQPAHVKRHARLCVGPDVDQSVWSFIRYAWASVARTAIVPMQDVLELGPETRMNVPGTVGGRNWQWRMRPRAASPRLAARLAALTHACWR
jgi:4-alpha-glucanotransferase